jgi:hypothetical protein
MVFFSSEARRQYFAMAVKSANHSARFHQQTRLDVIDVRRIFANFTFFFSSEARRQYFAMAVKSLTLG